MSLKTTIFCAFVSLLVWSCTSDLQDEQLIDTTSNKTLVQQQADTNDNEALEGENILIDLSARSGGGNCNNVVIVNGYAYASCGSQITIEELTTGETSTVNVQVIDIAADAQRGLLFTYSGTIVRMYTLEDPMAPLEVASANNVFFGAFTGISAAGCTLAVSGGTTNTTVFRYSANTLELELTENSIPAVDNVTGTPEVHVAQTGPSEITAFYSQDIGAVANWAIQRAIFNGVAELQSTPERTVLTPRPFVGSGGSTNFPVESEYLNGLLYVAHFGVPGIEIVVADTGDLLTPISLPYNPVNIGTDGELLFVVGLDNDEVDIIDPSNNTVIESVGSLQNPTSVDANDTHIVVADQTLGLVVIPRS